MNDQQYKGVSGTNILGRTGYKSKFDPAKFGLYQISGSFNYSIPENPGPTDLSDFFSDPLNLWDDERAEAAGITADELTVCVLDYSIFSEVTIPEFVDFDFRVDISPPNSDVDRDILTFFDFDNNNDGRFSESQVIQNKDLLGLSIFEPGNNDLLRFHIDATAGSFGFKDWDININYTVTFK